jgi:hypothetical protein
MWRPTAADKQAAQSLGFGAPIVSVAFHRFHGVENMPNLLG